MSIEMHGHFGLTTTPFTREFPVDKRYQHPQYDEQLETLHQTVEDRMSGALIAPAGCGKTVLLRTLRAMLPEARYRTRYIKIANLSGRDMCREIAAVVGCQPANQFNTLLHRIQDHLRTTLDHDGIRPVLIIDEGHELRPEVLGMLRVLTNFDMDSRLVVSIILCGQKPLATMLRRVELEAISRRLAHVGTLRNLSREEIRNYIQHRLTMAGGQSDLFDQGAHDAIFEIARGNLRATDRLALKGLQLAAIDKAAAVDANHVAKAKERLWP